MIALKYQLLLTILEILLNAEIVCVIRVTKIVICPDRMRPIKTEFSWTNWNQISHKFCAKTGRVKRRITHLARNAVINMSAINPRTNANSYSIYDREFMLVFTRE